ncbi:Putative zinc metalloprotease [Rhodovulum sp. PH10]|uniref:site-2 protease family protein n=1 Tax=Rhodovulum sp. PH10 TaxID=1187851 RepID=UPI00027C2312|nr:site-2 protease family protein [Rhodovulum sp. PH10]EJW13044.1 Putative zinc metalloprotease [Rhodovulum sp. PH10]
MSWSVNIGTIAGTAVRIHLTFVLFLAWIFGASWVQGGPAAAWNGLAFMILLFACVLAHEFGHIAVARRFGVRTPDVTLLPIGGVARLERIPEKPAEEFLVAIAGPMVNVVIAAVLIVLLGAHGAANDLVAVESTRVSMLDRLAAVNVFLVLFNLIPAFPMDGGRVLRALLAIRLGHVRATEIAATIGQFTAFAFGFLGLFGNPILIFIAIFVYLAASSEAQLVAIRAMSRDVPVSAAMITSYATLAPDEPIEAAIETLLRTSQQEFPVVDPAGRLVGVLSRADMIRALKNVGPQAVVAEVMTTEIPIMSHRGRLEHAFRMLQEKQKPAVGVVDASHRLIGLVTSETVGEMLMVRDALPKNTRIGPWGRAADA